MLLFAVVEALQAGGEAVTGLVHDRDRLGQFLEAHHAQHRPEELRPMGVAAGHDTVLHAGGPEAGVVAEAAGQDGPRLAGLEHLERVLQIAAGRADERPDLRLQFPGGADGLAVDGVAQALLELGVVVDLRLQQQERGGRALLAGVAEGRVHHVLDGQVTVGHAGDDGGVLAARLGAQVQVRLVAQHRQGRLRAAGEDDGIDGRMADQLPTFAPARAGHELERFPGNAGAPEALAEFPGDEGCIGGGLEDHGIAGGEPGGDPAAGDGDGEVPRRHHHDHALGFRREGRHLLPPARRRPVQLDEIHRLGNLGVRLRHRLAAIGHGRAHEGAARAPQFVRHLAQQPEAISHRHPPPAVVVIAGATHGALDIVGAGLGAAADHHAGAGRVEAVAQVAPVVGFLAVHDHGDTRGLVAATRLPGGRDLLGPFAVVGQGEVGVGFVGEVLPAAGERIGRPWRQQAVLRPARRGRHRIDRPVGLDEGPFQPVPVRRSRGDAERIPQEVLRSGVLVEPPDQVADRIEEALLVADRRIEQHVLRQLEKRAALRVGHALEHLELHPVPEPAFGGQDQGVGQIEDVVRGDAEGDGGDVLWLHAFAHHAQEVGIGVALAAVGSQRPVLVRRLKAFHLHVGPLDQTQDDGGAAAGHASAGPFVEQLLVAG